MAEVLLITTTDIKRNSVVSGSVDVDKFIQYLKIAQDIHIQQYLGTDLLVAIQGKIQDGTITNDDINSAAAIQTTKIKGFYTGNYKTNVSSTTNGVEIKLSDLSIPPLNSNSTIIIHSNTTNLSIKSCKNLHFLGLFSINVIFTFLLL